MNKSDLIEYVANDAEITQAAAKKAIDSVIATITKTLKNGGKVSLLGFGIFTVEKRAARTGHNPRNGNLIKIRAKKVPKFRPGKALKEALN